MNFEGLQLLESLAKKVKLINVTNLVPDKRIEEILKTYPKK